LNIHKRNSHRTERRQPDKLKQYGNAIIMLAAFTGLLLSCLPRVVQGEPVAHIVAAVNNEVITSIDLARAVRFNVALGDAASADAKKLEQETLEGLINRQLLLQEARRLRFIEVSEQEMEAEVEKLRKRFSSSGKEFPDFLAGLNMTKDELSRMLGERLLVERFIEKKVGLFVRVSRDEAQTYFDEHPSEFKDKRFPDVQKKITALLMERRLGQQVEQYLAELRGRADVRVNP